MIMLKDNHIDFAGGITQALNQTVQYLKHNNLNLKIIVEARDMDEIDEIIQHGGANRILIDNFGVNETKKAVDLIAGRFETESSGGINEVMLRHYAECGVDYISSGALTHSVYNLDLSLKAF
jgi:nicotinate-nucleotide pyrophosphorylase (carboxylating)